MRLRSSPAWRRQAAGLALAAASLTLLFALVLSIARRWLPQGPWPPLTLLAGSWISVDQLEQRLLRLQRSDLERVDQLLQEHLGDARRQLDTFAELPDPQRQDSIALLLPIFADVYQLNGRLEVQRVLLGSTEIGRAHV